MKRSHWIILGIGVLLVLVAALLTRSDADTYTLAVRLGARIESTQQRLERLEAENIALSQAGRDAALGRVADSLRMADTVRSLRTYRAAYDAQEQNAKRLKLNNENLQARVVALRDSLSAFQRLERVGAD